MQCLFITFLLFIQFTSIENTVHFDTYSYGRYKVEDDVYGTKNTQLIGKIQYRNPKYVEITKNPNLSQKDVETQILKTIRKRLATGVLILTEIFTSITEKALFHAYLLKESQILILLIPENDKILPGENLLCNEAPMLFESPKKPCPKTDAFSQTIHEGTLLKFEEYLLNSNPRCSINFVILSKKTYDLHIESLKSINLLQSRLVVGTVPRIIEPVETNRFQGTNLYGFVKGDPEIADRGLIAFVTHYDTYSLVQRYSSGSKTTNSGVIALLELAKTISLMYKSKPGKYDVLFLFTAISLNDFSGTEAFLISHEKTSKRLNLAICLDTISGNDLFFHASKMHQGEEYLQFIQGLEKYSKMMNKNFKMVTNKIKFYNESNYLQHEVFSRKKIISGTLTNLEKPEKLLNRSKIFDIKIDIEQLKKNVDIILKSFVDMTYQLVPFTKIEQADSSKLDSGSNSSPIEINENDINDVVEDMFDKYHYANTSYHSLLALNSWISNTPRTFGDNKLSNAYFIPEAMDYLSKFMDNPKINSFKTRQGKLTVYLENEYKAHYFFNKHLLFDFIMLLFTITYLFAITIVTVGSVSGAIQCIGNYLFHYGKNEGAKKRVDKSKLVL